MTWKRTTATAFTVLALAGAVGCSSDEPSGYGYQRPPIDQLDPRDRGLQSKEVVEASDLMAMSLLRVPELNASDRRWTVVVTGTENLTVTQRQSLDIFVQRLKGNLARQGRDRVQLIENRDRLRAIQSRELEGVGEREDEFGQTDRVGRPAPGPAGIQPDFALYAVARDLPNRATDYYLFEFTLTDLRTREQVWSDMYEVRTRN